MKTFEELCDEVALEKGYPTPVKKLMGEDSAGDYWWSFDIFEEAARRFVMQDRKMLTVTLPK